MHTKRRKGANALVRQTGLKERVEWEYILRAKACLTFGLGCCDCLLDESFTEKDPFVSYPLNGLFDRGNNALLMQRDEHPQGTCDPKTM
jgi:hypothetical protein